MTQGNFRKIFPGIFYYNFFQIFQILFWPGTKMRTHAKVRIFLNTVRIFLNTVRIYLNTVRIYLNKSAFFLNTVRIFLNNFSLFKKMRTLIV